MRSAREQFDADEREALLGLEHVVVKLRFFRALCQHRDDHYDVFRLVLLEIVDERGRLLARHAASHAKVCLFELARLDLRAQSLRRLARLGEHHHAAGRAVEPVHQAAIDALLVIFLHQMLLDDGQHVRVARLVRLRRHICRFDDDDDVPVLVQHDEIVYGELSVSHEYSSKCRCIRTATLCLRRSEARPRTIRTSLPCRPGSDAICSRSPSAEAPSCMS